MADNLTSLLLPEPVESFRKIIEKALSEWKIFGEIKASTITGGKSGSAIFDVDIRPNNSPSIKSGRYVLKVSSNPEWEDQEDEITAHDRALKRNSDYSSRHIPTLLKRYPGKKGESDSNGYVMLFDVAGKSFARFSTTDSRENGTFLSIIEKISQDILSHWSDPQWSEDLSPGALLKELSGYRYDPDSAEELHNFSEKICGTSNYFVKSGTVLSNPLSFSRFANSKNLKPNPVLRGLCHNDLHGGNILADSKNPTPQNYWLIDFAMSAEGPMGFDHAYNELSHLLKSLSGSTPELFIKVLEVAESLDEQIPAPDGGLWSVELIRKFRRSISEWCENNFPNRQDDIERQMHICRMAAGINWANKPVSDLEKELALCYAGWAGREYLKKYEPRIWSSIDINDLQSPQLGDELNSPSPEERNLDQELWQEFWIRVNGFSSQETNFILVTDRMIATEKLKAFGQIPWLAIIDLDDASDSSGLHQMAGPILSTRRSVHTFSSIIPVSDPRRSTSWMMANGWNDKGEKFADYNEWRWQALPKIRKFAKQLAEKTSPDPIKVIVLQNTPDSDRNLHGKISGVLEALDESSMGRAQIFLLGVEQSVPNISQSQSIPIATNQFVEKIAESFGTSSDKAIAWVPGPEKSQKEIPIEILRSMQENFEVLHSNILDSSDGETYGDSEFWRGRPPTWIDLDQNVDIPRFNGDELEALLSGKLEESRNQTVLLSHHPGSGGTTMALRAAWQLKNRYPVAVLRKHSPALGNRLRDLFHLAERPVLLVAEASVLTETAREEIHRFLSKHNCRVVVLYVRRAFGVEKTTTTNIPSFMNKEESSEFLKLFGGLTTDNLRRQDLKKITNDPVWKNYRVPFFYGLIAYQRDYLGIEKFIDNHLKKVRKSARDVVEYLAFVTIFSSSGLSLNIIKLLMGEKADSKLSLIDLLGSGPASLLTMHNGKVRMMHQIIAEETFRFFNGASEDQWKLELAKYAIDFIIDTVAISDPQAMEELFRQIFIDRMDSRIEGEDRQQFSPLISMLDSIDSTLGQKVLETLTKECPHHAHFWTHRGRHQIYRVGRDLDKAEEFLERATDLAPDDSIHHHTFGLVLRSRVRQNLEENKKAANLRHLFDSIEPFFARAEHEFRRSRECAPDDIYGHIAHVQLITSAVKAIRNWCGIKSIGELDVIDQTIASWCHEQLASAEDLLRSATYLHGTVEHTNEYLVQCNSDMDNIYGDLDMVVERWEVVNARSVSGQRSRRALANAYLTRSHREWGRLSDPELLRIIDLMRDNIGSTQSRDDDYELWFLSYLHSSIFDMDEALAQLSIWVKRAPTWRAFFYMYVLHFMLWNAGRTNKLEPMEDALQKCGELHIGRKNTSLLWIGRSENDSQLITSSQLGKWDNRKRFFSKTNILTRTDGMIDENIVGPQAGHILIKGKAKAFFVPGTQFSANRDENAPVNFFVGFSPSGLRGWSVSRGHLNAESKVDQTEPVLSTKKPTDKEKKTQIDKLRYDRLFSFVHEYVAAKSHIGLGASLNDILCRVEAVFCKHAGLESLGISDFQSTLRDIGTYKFSKDGSEILVHIVTSDEDKTLHKYSEELTHAYGVITSIKNDYGFINAHGGEDHFFLLNWVDGASRSKVAVGETAKFLPGIGDKGPIASSISVVEDAVWTPNGHIEKEVLNSKLSSFIESELSNTPDGMTIKQLSAAIATNFQSLKPLKEILGYSSVTKMVSGLCDVDVSGQFPTINVKLSKSDAIGMMKIPPAPKKKKPKVGKQKSKSLSSEQDDAKTNELERQVVSRIVELLQFKESPMYAANLGSEINKSFPDEPKIYRTLGYRSLIKFLETIPDVEMKRAEIGPDYLVWLVSQDDT